MPHFFDHLRLTFLLLFLVFWLNCASTSFSSSPSHKDEQDEMAGRLPAPRQYTHCDEAITFADFLNSVITPPIQSTIHSHTRLDVSTHADMAAYFKRRQPQLSRSDLILFSQFLSTPASDHYVNRTLKMLGIDRGRANMDSALSQSFLGGYMSIVKTYLCELLHVPSAERHNYLLQLTRLTAMRYRISLPYALAGKVLRDIPAAQRNAFVDQVNQHTPLKPKPWSFYDYIQAAGVAFLKGAELPKYSERHLPLPSAQAHPLGPEFFQRFRFPYQPETTKTARPN